MHQCWFTRAEKELKKELASSDTPGLVTMCLAHAGPTQLIARPGPRAPGHRPSTQTLGGSGCTHFYRTLSDKAGLSLSLVGGSRDSGRNPANDGGRPTGRPREEPATAEWEAGGAVVGNTEPVQW